MSEEYKITGTIKSIGDTQEGVSKAGKAWKKLSFQVSNNSGYEGREALFSFNLFGEEKVEKFLKFNKQGSEVDVKFNIECREWQGKYFTNLSAWSVFKAEDTPTEPSVTDEEAPF